VQPQKRLERGKVASNTGWSGNEICTGRTQGSGWKIVRNEFRQVERLRGMKSFPGDKTQNHTNITPLSQPIMQGEAIQNYYAG